MKAATPIRRRKLYEDVVEQIQSAILNGEFSSGDMLPSERELRETFGVGRTSIREALFALQRMGLVTVSNGERARVSSPTPGTMVGELAGAARYLLSQPNGMRHFQEARLVFEVALARVAAERASDADLAGLKQLLEANRQAVTGDEHVQMKTDVAFHYRLAQISGNPIFTALHVGVEEWLAEQRIVGLRAPGSARAAYRAHKRIFEAVAAHDPVAAERAMRDHLAEVEAYYWKAVKV